MCVWGIKKAEAAWLKVYFNRSISFKHLLKSAQSHSLYSSLIPKFLSRTKGSRDGDSGCGDGGNSGSCCAVTEKTLDPRIES